MIARFIFDDNKNQTDAAVAGNHNSANSAPPAAEDTGNADNVAQNSE